MIPAADAGSPSRPPTSATRIGPSMNTISPSVEPPSSASPWHFCDRLHAGGRRRVAVVVDGDPAPVGVPERGDQVLELAHVLALAHAGPERAPEREGPLHGSTTGSPSISTIGWPISMVRRPRAARSSCRRRRAARPLLPVADACRRTPWSRPGRGASTSAVFERRRASAAAPACPRGAGTTATMPAAAAARPRGRCRGRRSCGPRQPPCAAAAADGDHHAAAHGPPQSRRGQPRCSAHSSLACWIFGSIFGALSGGWSSPPSSGGGPRRSAP